jgi:hypothetical protein
MVRAGLALWYTLTVLLGPMLCCCAIRTAPTTEHVAEATPVEKKCCCPAEAPDPCADPADRTPPTDHHPDGCPCKKLEQQVQDRPGLIVGGTESGAKPRSLDLPIAMPFAASHLAAAEQIETGGADSRVGAAGLAGRDLLTAYHILRC